jgi:Phytanoyl-CoA dioxygenase (PhyH)
MLTRTSGGYLVLTDDQAPRSAVTLQTQGYVVLKGVLKGDMLEAVRADVERVFEEYAPDDRGDYYPPGQWVPYRYEMLNRSALVQKAIALPKILKVIEPLLGEDCHVIANTAWWQRTGDYAHLGKYWHIDSGPHVPRPSGVPWDDRIPYPVFAIAAHICLQDLPIEAGPTGVIPGSHTSGQAPPMERLADPTLDYNGRGVVPLVAKAGDVGLFVSDIWHRRLPPSPHDPGRMFIQCHYGRRDIAQRLRPTDEVNHLTQEALARARTPRQQTLVGRHELSFYDS